MGKTTRGWWRWLGLTALLSAVAGGAPRFVETPLGRVPDSLIARALNRLAVTVRGAEHDAVVVDGRRYPTAGRVERLVFTPDGQQVYWYVSRRGQGQWTLDGEAITPWGATRNLPVRLADGQFSWAMAEAKGVRVMHGERSLGLFAEARPAVAELEHSGAGNDIQNLFWPRIDRGWGAPVANGVWRDGKEHPRHVICDEGTLGPFDEIGALAMSADKRHWACFVQQGQRWALLRDGRLGDWHDKIGGPCGGCCCDDLGTPLYSANGEQLIYQTSDAGRVRLWLGDRATDLPATCRRNVSALVSRDGQHLFYEPEPLVWMVDGRPLVDGAKLQSVGVGPGPTWLAEEQTAHETRLHTEAGVYGPYRKVGHAAIDPTTGAKTWTAQDAEGWGQWVDGKLVARLRSEHDRPIELVGRRAEIVKDGRREALSVDGERSPWFDRIDDHHLVSEDGRHLVSTAVTQGQAAVLLDGRVVARASALDQVSLSPDSSGEPRELMCEYRNWATLASVAFSVDASRRVVIWDSPGESRVEIDSAPPFSMLDFRYPQFDADNRHLAAQVELAEHGPRHIWVDGAVGPAYTEWNYNHDGRFGPDGVFRQVVERGAERVLVEVSWPD